MQEFGPISFVLNTKKILKLGPVPVFYVPPDMGNSHSFQLMVSIVHYMKMIDQFIDDIDYLHSATYSEVKQIFESSVSYYEFTNFQKIFKIVLKNLLFDSSVAIDFRGALSTVGKALYPTERAKDDETTYDFNFFQQREWRIFSDLVACGYTKARFNLVDTKILL